MLPFDVALLVLVVTMNPWTLRCKDSLHWQNADVNSCFNDNVYFVILPFKSPSCLKTWYHDQPMTSTVNYRQLIFGALLPPWDHRGTVTIHLHLTFATSVNVRDFLAELQRFAPGLQVPS